MRLYNAPFMDKIFKELEIAIRKQRMIEEEWNRNNPDTYKKFTNLMEKYFAQEENMMKDLLTRQKTNKNE